MDLFDKKKNKKKKKKKLRKKETLPITHLLRSSSQSTLSDSYIHVNRSDLYIVRHFDTDFCRTRWRLLKLKKKRRKTVKMALNAIKIPNCSIRTAK